MTLLIQQFKAWLKRDHPEPETPSHGVPVLVEDGEPETLVDMPTPIDINTQVLSFLFEVDLVTDRVSVKPQGRIADMVKSLRKADFRQKSVPRVPVVFPQLLRCLRDPDSTSQDLVDLIARDPLIASAVLKMVNSAYYNPEGKQIDSFHRAVVILGLEGMRTIVASAVMQPIIGSQQGDFPRFNAVMWDHAVQTGMICQELALEAHLDSFTAYLAGLIHDMGAITLTNMISRRMKETGSSVTPLEVIGAVDSVAQELTSLIAADWGLPAAVVDALDDQRRASPRSPMGRLLRDSHFLSDIYLLSQSGLIEREVAEQIRASVEAPERLFLRLDDQMGTERAA